MMENLLEESVDHMLSVYRFHERIGDPSVIVTYQGEINQELIRSLTTLIETNLAKLRESENVIGRVYHVMIESLQNIVRHADSIGGDELINQRSGIFLAKQEGRYVITTGNLIANQKKEKLAQIIDGLNEMDQKELKALYKDRVYNAEVSEKGGAGIGFIEMARKSKNPIYYRFEKTTGQFSYVFISIFINSAF